MVSKAFKKLVINTLVDHLEKCFSFMISSTVSGLLNQMQILWKLHLIELLRDFNRFRATPAVALHISNAFEFSVLVFITKLGLMKFLVSYLSLFCLFSVIDNFEWIWIWSLLKNIQLMLVFLEASFWVQHFPTTYINELLDVFCNTAMYADDATLYSKWDQACDLWQQLELVSDCEYDLREHCELR